MSMTIPIGSGPSHAHTGSMRYNPGADQLEIYTGNQWIPAAGVREPQTWRGWLDYFAREMIDHGSMDNKLRYIQHKMWERFPGSYTIKHVGNGEFDLDFDTPEDQTWFHLKYE